MPAIGIEHTVKQVDTFLFGGLGEALLRTTGGGDRTVHIHCTSGGNFCNHLFGRRVDNRD